MKVILKSVLILYFIQNICVPVLNIYVFDNRHIADNIMF